MSVAVVTDSTAYLPQQLVAEFGIEVVPLYVVLTGRSGREGLDVGPAEVARTLAVRGQRVTTSRPTPGDFVAAYRARLAAGADRIVSIHLSMELSGTWDAARTAALEVGEHLVKVVDTRSAAMGTGFAVLAAARAAAAGAGVEEVAAAAQRTADTSSTLFVVDTLEHLRRGGRIGSAAAVLGTALSVKPVLHVEDGRIVALEKVRTTSRAVARLVQRVVDLAGTGPVSLAVHHLAAPEQAQALATQLAERVPDIRELHVSELGAAIGAHVGPGALGVVVDPSGRPSSRRPADAGAPRDIGNPGAPVGGAEKATPGGPDQVGSNLADPGRD